MIAAAAVHETLMGYGTLDPDLIYCFNLENQHFRLRMLEIFFLTLLLARIDPIKLCRTISASDAFASITGGLFVGE